MSLKFKGGYELEFAIDSENEFKALRVLADVFGENIKREIKFPEVAKRDELVFITHCFTKDELSDDNYKKLLKNEKNAPAMEMQQEHLCNAWEKQMI